MKKIYDFGVAPGTNEYYRLWRAANREKVRARAKKYYDADPQKQRERSRKYKATEHGKRKADERYQRWRETGKYERWRRKHMLKTFGLTIETYDAMLAAQDRKCAICRSDSPKSKGRKFFFVDHCHVTGNVRGLLCTICNSGIGYFKDDPALLSAALQYLLHHQR